MRQTVMAQPNTFLNTFRYSEVWHLVGGALRTS